MMFSSTTSSRQAGGLFEQLVVNGNLVIGYHSRLSSAVMCVFCDIVTGAVPAHVVHSDDLTLAFLDVRPLFPGHTLLIPRAHVETLADLPEEMLAPYFAAAQLLSRAMEEVMGAEGSFVAMNNKISQSVPHLHIHVVPRRRKDGLRGFFWPRSKYASDEAMVEVATRLREGIALLKAGS
jgi:histidine triad (HIT) family protein